MTLVCIALKLTVFKPLKNGLRYISNDAAISSIFPPDTYHLLCHIDFKKGIDHADLHQTIAAPRSILRELYIILPAMNYYIYYLSSLIAMS